MSTTPDCSPPGRLSPAMKTPLTPDDDHADVTETSPFASHYRDDFADSESVTGFMVQTRFQFREAVIDYRRRREIRYLPVTVTPDADTDASVSDSPASDEAAASDETAEEDFEWHLVSPIVGYGLIVGGMIELIVPLTPFGIPMITAGVLIVAPGNRVAGGIDRFMRRRCPGIHERSIGAVVGVESFGKGVIDRFRSDFKKRYPE